VLALGGRMAQSVGSECVGTGWADGAVGRQ